MAPPRARGDRGQAAVELAVLLPLVVVLLVVVLQVGLVARDVVLVAHAAREAARAAAVDPEGADARQAALRAGGLDPDRLDVEVQALSTTVRVTAVYRVPTTLPLVGRLLADPVTRATVTMRREDLERPSVQSETKRDKTAGRSTDSPSESHPWKDLST